MTVSVPPGYQEFHEFVRLHEGRLVRTGVERLLRQLTPEDPQNVGWLIEAAGELGDRLVAAEPDVVRGTAYTYSSRLRGAAKRYLARLQAPNAANVDPDSRTRAEAEAVGLGRGVRSRRSSGRELAPREQLEDAYEALVRWPDLRRFVAPALVEAERVLLQNDQEPSR